jgi:hypothetical protein
MTPRAVVSRRREFFPTSHSDLRITWHPEADTLVLTLWSGTRCTGSAPLSAADAGRLTAFIACRLAERATTPVRNPSESADVLDAARGLVRAVRRRWGERRHADSPS